MTRENLIFLDEEWDSKELVLKHLAKALADDGIIADQAAYLDAVYEREKISATGLENGLAIPHGKSATVKEAGFAIAKLKKPVANWESIDPENQVDLVILLAIPESEAGSTHLQLLAELSTRLMNETFFAQLKQAETKQEVMAALTYKPEKTQQEKSSTGKKIVGITACAAGIAHTYMAAEALEQAAAKQGISMRVEKQGANGIEDRLTQQEIEEADGVIFATDIAAKNKERFVGKPYIERRVADPLKHADDMVQRVLTQPDGIVQGDKDAVVEDSGGGNKTSVFRQIYQGVLTGISYMIPVIVSAGLMIGVGQIGAAALGLADVISDPKFASDPNQLIVIFHYLVLYGNMIMKFMYPVFSAFVAYSIADRPGLAPGFIGGAFAAGFHFILWNEPDGVPSGFMGALILGLVAGFVAKFLNDKIKLHKNLQAMKPMFLIPGITVLVIFFLNFYIVDPVFGGLNKLLQDWVMANQDSSAIILSTIIACLTAFDLGGPVNKAAGTVAIGLAADHIFPLTPRVLSIVIPPIGIGLATMIDKFVVRRRVFDAEQRTIGTTSLILGFLAIGEGAIPFMLKNPIITITINMMGAVLGSLIAVTLGAVQWYPLPAFWGWPLVENLPAYLLGMLCGILFIAFANIFVRYALIKRKERKNQA